ncbi:MAG: YqgE/AlgH family protein [Alphaproteobacteria bacterium]|nr:YqgE/AlgH family protein [Alphaproteobacteria bacterium]MDD9920455.1 YqgE/AlgH family protein [Alphaproteobacteria bacterium]
MLQTDSIINTLQNHFLVATTSLNDSIFERTVIYMCTHDENGAMGVIVNRPLNSVSFTDIADSMGVKPLIDKKPPTIFNGGPVDKNRGFVVHSPDYKLKNSLNVGQDISLSATADIVKDIAVGQGPQDMAFCLGYAGWSAGQLEQEIVENSWLVLQADADTLFHVEPQEKYDYCTRRIGLNALNFSDTIGLA